MEKSLQATLCQASRILRRARISGEYEAQKGMERRNWWDQDLILMNRINIEARLPLWANRVIPVMKWVSGEWEKLSDPSWKTCNSKLSDWLFVPSFFRHEYLHDSPTFPSSNLLFLGALCYQGESDQRIDPRGHETAVFLHGSLAWGEVQIEVQNEVRVKIVKQSYPEAHIGNWYQNLACCFLRSSCTVEHCEEALEERQYQHSSILFLHDYFNQYTSLPHSIKCCTPSEFPLAS